MAWREGEDGVGREASWAVIRVGGKQHRVRSGDRLDIARSDFLAATLPNADGRRLFTFDDILIVRSHDGETIIGAPTVPNARVVAELLSEKRDRKVVAFKKRRRQNSRRRHGHRQWLQPLVVVSVDSGISLVADVMTTRRDEGRQEPLAAFSTDTLSKTLSVLRGGDAQSRLNALLDVASSAARRMPGWAGLELAKAVEPLLLNGQVSQRSAAALALCAVTGGPYGNEAEPDVVAEALTRYFAETRRRYFLDVDLLWQPASEDVRQYQATVRLRHRLGLPGTNLDVRLGEELAKKSHLEVTVSGPGVDAGTVRITTRREKPYGTSYEAVIGFDNDAATDTVAVLDVVVDGRRIERRFLSLDDHAVTRAPPERVSRDAKLMVNDAEPEVAAL